MSIYDAAMRYRADGVPLVVLAGREYGSGSSRDWAAKGPALLGVRAVIAESFERIHRSNLLGMGILPLQFADGASMASLGLTGEETFDIAGLDAFALRGGPQGDRGARRHGRSSTPACGSTRPWRPSTSATGASWRTSCASSLAEPGSHLLRVAPRSHPRPLEARRGRHRDLGLSRTVDPCVPCWSLHGGDR